MWISLSLGVGYQIGIDLETLEFAILLHLHSLEFDSSRGILRLSLEQVKRLASKVLLGSNFLTSITFFPTFEIIVLTFRAFPSTLRELEVTPIFFAF